MTTDGMHLGDVVEVVTDAFAPVGASRGALGVIVDDWADGSSDVEVREQSTGEVVARFRAAADEIRAYTGTERVRQPREHGILFGRGDDLGTDVEEPPATGGIGLFNIPGYTPTRMAFSDPPAEPVELDGDIPWELREEPPAPPPPQTGPIVH